MTLKRLLTFEYDKIRVIPLGVLGVVGIFLLSLLLEILLGSVFYSIGDLGFKQTPLIASVIINIGLWVTKIVILLVVAKLTIESGSPRTQSPFKNWVKSDRIKRLLVLTAAIVIFYRLAYDSQLGLMIVKNFGIDPDLTESMQLILGAPVLGVLYIMIIAPIFEEIFFRGIIFGGLRQKGHGVIFATIVSALLFALMHMNVAQGVNAFFLGLLAAYVYHQTGNLKSAIWLHVINNTYVVFSSGWMDGIFEKIPILPRLIAMSIGILVSVFLLNHYRLKAERLNTLE
jgi:membrane protease YdiL (CAAX protease family)